MTSSIILAQRELKPLFIFGYSNALYTESYAPVNETAKAGYCNFCRAAVQAIHDEDPNTIVTTSGLGGMDYSFLRGLVSEMGITSTNGIGLHPYGIGMPGYPNGRMTDNLLRYRSIVSQYLNDTSSNYTKNGLSPIALKGQANQAVQSLLAACAVEFPIVIYYDLRNDGTDPADREQNFGLLFNNYTDKPAMSGVRVLTSQIGNRTYEGLLSTKPSPLVAMRFSGQNDSLVVVWSGEFKTSMVVNAVNASGVWDMYGNQVDLTNGTFRISDEDGVMYIKYPKRNVNITPAISSVKPIYSPTPIVSSNVQRNSSSQPSTESSKRLAALSSVDSTFKLSLVVLFCVILSFFIFLSF